SLAVVGGLHQSRARATADRVRAMDSLVASIRGGELADRAADPVPPHAPSIAHPPTDGISGGGAASGPGSDDAAPAARRGGFDRADSLDRCASTALADQRACLLARLAESDAPLNQVYQQLVARMRGGAGVDARAPDPPAVQRLRAEQRAWLAARDRDCARIGAGREPPAWAPVRARCLAAFSENRAAVLRARLGMLGG
ncbi:MAG: lysozyme inhibitor LprI family protein, partial [Gemmatimonadaceae bacterium]